APAVTDKDREDIALALDHVADYIAISFVRRASDVEAVRSLVPGSVRLIAKIEKAAALADLPAIVDAADAIMVARGDLGVELPFEEVPLVEKRVIITANARGRAVITATQMLATCTAAEMLEVPLIVCFTKSGFTPRKITAHRPGVPILGLSTEASTCRHLALIWGVVPELADRVPNYDAMLDVAREALLGKGY